MSIATKTGDDGTTAIMFGRRMPKTDVRIEANGAIDEFNAALGLVRASVSEPFITEEIFRIQKELVAVMGELAVVEEDRERYLNKGYHFVDAGMVDRLTAIIDDLEANHRISFKKWATPGDSAGSAALDFARTVCRRAERRVVELAATDGKTNPEIVRYLNRLSDLCWLYARWLETRADPAPPAQPSS